MQKLVPTEKIVLKKKKRKKRTETRFPHETKTSIARPLETQVTCKLYRKHENLSGKSKKRKKLRELLYLKKKKKNNFKRPTPWK